MTKDFLGGLNCHKGVNMSVGAVYMQYRVTVSFSCVGADTQKAPVSCIPDHFLELDGFRAEIIAAGP